MSITSRADLSSRGQLLAGILISDAILLGVLAFPLTNLGVNSMQFGGRYIPEPFFLLWLACALSSSRRRNFIFNITLSYPAILGIIIFSSISLIAGFGPDFSLVAFYGRYRALLVFGLSIYIVYYCTAKGMRDGLVSGVIVFCTGAMVCSIVESILRFGGDSVKIGVPSLAYCMLICFLSERKHFTWAVSVSVLFVLVSFLSFWRQNYVISGTVMLALLLVMTSGALRVGGGRVLAGRSLIPLIFLSCGAVVSLPIISTLIVDYMHSDPVRYDQSIGKFVTLFNNISAGGGASEQARVSQISFLINQSTYYLLPNGLVDDGNLTFKSIWGGLYFDVGGSIVRDSIIGYFIVVFGLLLTFILISLLLVVFVVRLMRERSRYAILLMYLAIPLLILVMVDGLSMTQMQRSVYVGLTGAFLFIPTQSFYRRREKRYRYAL